ncbi:hypothetical protein EHV15_01035 [Paenibacillus oralis]|uniref:Uncharacterized protein n=1 Tax=Paenibacillus oralis TaxID=2490856 RepID=A0A3P3TUA8_9BACL|nr:hypothetical protein [Paenibacillus oralis]RRJ61715.1 hypothetical protein EHV15_01035 [Paenibacillus oralis]
MNKLFTKAVIVEPRIECPTWISEKIEYKAFVILSGQSDESDVELFLTHLFLYNGIDLDRSLKDSFNALFIMIIILEYVRTAQVQIIP